MVEADVGRCVEGGDANIVFAVSRRHGFPQTVGGNGPAPVFKISFAILVLILRLTALASKIQIHFPTRASILKPGCQEG